MKTLPFITAIAATAVSLSAQEIDPALTAASASPAQHAIKMFTAAQVDSVLAFVPGIDSLRRGSGIIGVGRDSIDNSIIVIAFDQSGIPAKFMFPDSVLMKQPAALPGPARAETPHQLDQRGRTWFIIETALKSAYVFPMSYRRAFKHADGGTIGGISLLTIGGSLYGTFAFTKNMELGYGRVGLMNYGSSFLGSHYPFLLSSFLHNATSINDTGSTFFDVTPTDQIKAWCSIIGFPLGIYIGSRWKIVDNDDGGKVTLMGFFSQPTAYLLGYGLPWYFFKPNEDLPRDYFAASTMLTMALMPTGFYVGHKIAGDRHLSAGRGALPYVSGTMGGMTGFALPMLFYDSITTMATVRLLVTTTLLGYGGGTVLGLLYHPQTDYTYWQTVFIGASSGAGALIAEAIPIMTSTDNHRPYIIAGVAGAWAGFFLGEHLSRSLFEKSDRDRRETGLRVSLPGLAALPLLFSNDKNQGRRSCPPLPVAEVEWRF
jgi:hypothetical protein